MYRCDSCGVLFDEPLTVTERNTDGENTWEEHFAVCPVCGHDWYAEVEECPVCGEWMPKGYTCCNKCVGKVKNKMNDFLSSLEPPEVDALDEMLDGTSVHDLLGDCND